MSASGWNWANLSEEQVRAIEAAENELGVDYLIAYQASERDATRNILYFIDGLRVAVVERAKLDRIRDLEEKTGAVLVAYEAVARVVSRLGNQVIR